MNLKADTFSSGADVLDGQLMLLQWKQWGGPATVSRARRDQLATIVSTSGLERCSPRSHTGCAEGSSAARECVGSHVQFEFIE